MVSTESGHELRMARMPEMLEPAGRPPDVTRDNLCTGYIWCMIRLFQIKSVKSTENTRVRSSSYIAFLPCMSNLIKRRTIRKVIGGRRKPKESCKEG